MLRRTDHSVAYPNPLKRKLREKEIVLGTCIQSGDAQVVSSAISAGPDFIWLDTEHGPMGVESLELIPILMRLHGVSPVIRVGGNDPVLIKKALDVGAVAVMIPQVDSAEEAANAVRASKYAPLGDRGVAPLWPLHMGLNWNHVVQTANEESVVIVQLESQMAFDNLDQIIAIPGIDVMFIGRMDLSASVNAITQLDSPAVTRMTLELAKRLDKTTIVAGVSCGSAEEAKEYINLGYRFINVSSVSALLRAALKNELDTVRSFQTVADSSSY